MSTDTQTTILGTTYTVSQFDGATWLRDSRGRLFFLAEPYASGVRRIITCGSGRALSHKGHDVLVYASNGRITWDGDAWSSMRSASREMAGT